jgi:hypothetical protein
VVAIAKLQRVAHSLGNRYLAFRGDLCSRVHHASLHRERSKDIAVGSGLAAVKDDLRSPSPTVVLFRRGTQRQPAEQIAPLLTNLDTLAAELQAGSVAVIEPDRIRIRRLPLLP